MRCLTLADGLAKAGWRVAFAVGGATLTTVAALRNSSYECLEIGEDKEPTALHGRWPEGCDLLVVDHYGCSATFENACRPWAKCILVIDDLANRPHHADILLDQTLNRREEDYGPFAGPNCEMLVGSRYALLRPQFAAWRGAALARRRNGGPVRRILVSMGAVDDHDISSLALAAVEASGTEAVVDVVIGGASHNLASVRRNAERMPVPVVVHVEVTEMAALMAKADLAIGATGATSWERCCLGLPTLTVVTAKNQMSIATSLAKAGAIVHLGSHCALTVGKLADTLRALSRDAGDRYRLCENSAKVCDGLGVERVVAAIAPRIARPAEGSGT